MATKEKDKLPVKLKKVWWNFVNIFVSLYFSVRKLLGFPSYSNGEKVKKGWAISLDDDFSNLNNWRILKPSDWGSARSDNVCVYSESNVTCDNGIASIITVKETVTGTGWEGEPITRDFTSGWMETRERLPMHGSQVFRAKFRCEKNLGSWKAYWLYKDTNGTYQEIDGFEIFASKEKNLSEWSTTVHWGPSSADHTMYGRSVKLNTTDWLVMDIIVDRKLKLIKVKINGVLAYVTGLGLPKEEDNMIAIFSDCASTHDGKVSIPEIESNLPYLMQIDYFKVYSLGL